MATSLNHAAQQRAALNELGAIGPLACSLAVLALVAARNFGWTGLHAPILGHPALDIVLRLVLALEIPLIWLFLETTAWRRAAPARHGRRVLAGQGLALAVALVVTLAQG